MTGEQLARKGIKIVVGRESITNILYVQTYSKLEKSSVHVFA